MRFIIDFIKGIFVGIANVIPGVSGGTMAVSFGVYDKLVGAISGLLKSFKKSVKALLPIACGMAFGIIAFTFIIPILLEKQPFLTACAFTGLIVGGVPALINSLKSAESGEKKTPLSVNIVIFLLLLAASAVMPFLNGDSESGMMIEANPLQMVMVTMMGVIAAAAMVIPGVSGSLMLMILGYYFGIITSVKDFITALKNMDMKILIDRALILAPFALGCLLGLFFISKLISFLLDRFPKATYCGILGLVAASPVSVFYKVNEEYSMSGTRPLFLVLGVVAFFACIAVTLLIGRLGTEEKDD